MGTTGVRFIINDKTEPFKDTNIFHFSIDPLREKLSAPIIFVIIFLPLHTVDNKKQIRIWLHFRRYVTEPVYL